MGSLDSREHTTHQLLPRDTMVKRNKIRVRRVGVKRRRIAKRAPARRRGKMYGNKRPTRIQRATNVPKTCLISFVTDKTFLYTPADLPSGTDPMKTGVMQVSCNNLLTPMLATGGGTWQAQDGAAGDSVEGLKDWVTGIPDGGGRYQTYCVLGAKLDVNSIASQVIVGSGQQMTYVNNYACGIHKCTNGLTDIGELTQLPTAQKMPYTRIRNGTGSQNNTTGIQGVIPQGMRLSDTYSAKKWEGVTDVKDNKELHSTQQSNVLTPPAEGGKFQIFVASREPKSTGKQVPSQLIRIKCAYTVLLSDPKTDDNDPMKTGN
jgi:hypothetical protein